MVRLLGPGADSRTQVRIFLLLMTSFCVTLQNMSRSILRLIIISIVLPVLLTGMFTFSGAVTVFASLSQDPCGRTSTGPGFKKPCDMDQCAPNSPKCPLCPSFGSVTPFLGQETLNYLPPMGSSLLMTYSDSHLNQGFARSVFRPPASIL